MNIAVNTRLLLHNKLEGIGWFTYETLKRITKNHPEHQFYFIFDRPFHQDFVFSNNITPIVVSPPSRHPILHYIWFEWRLPKILKKIKADAFISTDGYISLRSKVPTLDVIHDLNFEHNPKDLGLADRIHYRRFFPKFAHHAKRLATVSEFSKNDIVKQYNINSEKIDVVYNGVNPIYKPITKEERDAHINNLTQGKNYFLYVGALHQRKNIARLLKGFDVFASNNNDVKLVIVGRKMWHDAEMESTFEKMTHKNNVIFTGRLSVEDLHLTLASALALVYIPYFEGFGIPIIEAMACKTAVITSNITSLPEVAGNAALTIDPYDINGIAKAMKILAENNEARKELEELGLERAKEFSWDKTADKLWRSFTKMVGNETN